MPLPIVQEQVSLLKYNTFGLDVTARFFVEITAASQLMELQESEYWEQKKLILGGGSNLLLLNDFDGLVIYMNNKGIKVVQEDDEYTTLKVEAGEVWHNFVLHCIEHNLGGVENLSLIPGSVGAAPMQNIGAYGVELESVFVELDAFHIEQGEWHNFPNELCEFDYRSSIFKTSHKGLYIITSVTFRLTKTHTLNTSYGAIQSILEKREIEIGNSGSFFKNPIIPNSQLYKLLSEHPKMPYYKVDDTTSKVPAGWLIEQCGWKGKKIGNTGSHHAQALVLVNHGNATGQEVWELAQKIVSSVHEQFDIQITPEVNIIE